MSQELISFFQVILNLIVDTVVPLLVGLVAVWIKRKIDEVKSKLTSQQITDIEYYTKIVVQAAEQSGLAKLIEDTAAAKKDYAIKTLQAILDSKGWKGFSVAELEAHIESAILNGIHKGDGNG